MRAEFDQLFVAKPGKVHDVKDFSTNFTAGIQKKEAEDLLRLSIDRLIADQDKFAADNRHSILIIFQAMDAAGKDGTIKHVMSGVNPQGCRVYNFKQPSAEELDHDYLWRTVKCLPERGMIGIFNRSHYEEVLVAKVHPEIIMNQQLPNILEASQINEKFWEQRYRQINDFERYLTENGTLILKFFLNVSKAEQKKRFMARLKDDKKNWKFSLADVKERGHWDDYMNAYDELLSKTSTHEAPWYVIPADNKWFMRYAVGQIICTKMEELNVQYPKLSEAGQIMLAKAEELLFEESDESLAEQLKEGKFAKSKKGPKKEKKKKKK